MITQSFSKKNLLRLLTVEDIIKHRLGPNKECRIDNIRLMSEKINKNDFVFSSLRKAHQAGSPVLTLEDFTEVMAVRKAANNISRAFNIKTSDRHYVVSAVKSLCKEDGPFSILKTDIKGFFEGVDRREILKNLLEEESISQKTKDIVKALFLQVDCLSTAGIPRGLAISSVLAEYALRDFDARCRSLDGCYYFSRYVDDIVIFFCDQKDSPISILEDFLPFELRLHPEKTKFISIGNKKVCKTADTSFTHLGYEFRFDKTGKNSPELGLSQKRINKIKTKFILALLDFSENKDFELLRSRLLFMGSNYLLRSGTHKGRLYTGIYYNNKYIDEAGIKDLRSVDVFISKNIYCENGTLGKRLGGILNDSQKRMLSSISMVKGFNDKKFRTFSRDELKKITRIWKRA